MSELRDQPVSIRDDQSHDWLGSFDVRQIICSGPRRSVFNSIIVSRHVFRDNSDSKSLIGGEPQGCGQANDARSGLHNRSMPFSSTAVDSNESNMITTLRRVNYCNRDYYERAIHPHSFYCPV
jgi:hypothetical protein